MVKTHKLPYSAGINQNFDLFPQKWVFRQVLLQFGVPLVKFHQYLPSLHIFIIILLYNSAGTCNIHCAKTYN